MTVAVACNLSDGVILGVDSAVTLPSPMGIAKVYENAAKLFQLGDKPIGIAIFGMGALGNRTLGSYIREFELTEYRDAVKKGYKLKDVAEALRAFFMRHYLATIVPEFEKQTGLKFNEVPMENRPGFGLVIGGFSDRAYLSEVWGVYIPNHDQIGTAECQRAEGDFGTNWFATYGPIQRYIKGMDAALVDELMTYIQQTKQVSFSENEIDAMQAILQKHEYQIPFVAMPMDEGIAHTRFLVDLAINHHRFALGAPIVGGKAKLGMVTYRGDKFQFLDNEGKENYI